MATNSCLSGSLRQSLARGQPRDAVCTIRYPSGATATYTRDTTGRITGVTAQASTSSTPVSLVTDVDYAPFGPLTRIVWGNGRVLDRTVDLNYAMDTIADSAVDGMSIDYGLDDAGNVVSLAERTRSGATAGRTVGYDDLDRLEAFKTPGGSVLRAYTYDATGNRQSATTGGTAFNYAYPSTNHRLTQTGTTTPQIDHGLGEFLQALQVYYDGPEAAEARHLQQYMERKARAKARRYNVRIGHHDED